MNRDVIPIVAAAIAVVFVGASLLQIPLAPQTSSGPTKVFSDAGKIDPYEVSIQGSIVDNYANLTYRMLYDNYASSDAKEIDWFLGLQSDMRLSNISVILNSAIYWGQVFPEVQAVQIYNDSVEANKSAVLVQRFDDGYSVKMNVEAGAEAALTIFIEGLLTRESGLYELTLPVGRNGIVNTGFSFNLDVISHSEPVAGYSVRGLPHLAVTDLVNGIRLQYSTATLTLEEMIEVKYALDKQTGGAQLLTFTNGTENFFVYMLAPSVEEEDDSARRQYVFVLDESGSMAGTKIAQAKSAFNAMVGSLRSIDIFNVISFDTTIQTLWLEPHSASATNIAEAQTWIEAISASGGTNFYGAAIAGLDTFTEGMNAKAMLILSDGQPTAGTVQDTLGILSGIEGANTLGVSISTVAFGSDADENLMSNIATQNDGFFEFIEPNEEASSKLLDFYRTFSIPVADDYEIVFSGATEVISLDPLARSMFLNGSEVIVAGRYVEGMTVMTTINYVNGTEFYSDTVGAASLVNEHVEYIWAQQRISYMLDIVSKFGENETLRAQIVDTGMQYGIAIAGYTAMVLTAYDAEETPEEPTTTPDSTTGTYSVPPPAATNTYATAIPPPPAAIDPLLTGFVGLVGVLFVFGVVVLFISRVRRG